MSPCLRCFVCLLFLIFCAYTKHREEVSPRNEDDLQTDASPQNFIIDRESSTFSQAHTSYIQQHLPAFLAHGDGDRREWILDWNYGWSLVILPALLLPWFYVECIFKGQKRWFMWMFHRKVGFYFNAEGWNWIKWLRVDIQEWEKYRKWWNACYLNRQGELD